METKKPATPKLLGTVPEVAKMLSIGRSNAYGLVAAGVIPSVRIGSSVRIPLDSLDAWLAKLKG